MKIAIFASGNGSNAENIIKYFAAKQSVATVELVLSNKADAYVLERAKRLAVPYIVFTKAELKDGSVLEILRKFEIDFVVLAGFLMKIPEEIVAAFDKRIVNIHPSLLPKYGGKGMYGDRVHQAVFDAHESKTGITIHYLSNIYDDGEIIFQATCPVTNNDTPETIAQKVHQLEYEHYPEEIEKAIKTC